MFEKQLPIVEIDYTGTPEKVDPNVDLQICENDLLTEFSEQAPKFAFYGGLYTDATITLAQFENELRTFEAENELSMRDEIRQRYGETEKITEAKMEAAWHRNSEWQSLRKAVLMWKQRVLRLEMVKDAFKQRAQMLWNIGATRRQEMVRLGPSNTEE